MPTIEKKRLGFPAQKQRHVNIVGSSTPSVSSSDSDDMTALRAQSDRQQRIIWKRLKAGSHHSCDDGFSKYNPENKQSVGITEVELKFAPAKTNLCPAPPCPYEYWWAPKPKKKKGKVQPAPRPTDYMNVMYDRRVIRGPNFSADVLNKSDPFDKAAELRRQNALKKITETMCKPRNKRNVIGTVPPVPGRLHHDVQTEKYLEELVARPPAFDVDTQTDLFLMKPPEPPYIPSKVGVDVGTEIADGELFHFDAEAQPIIEVLVDGAIEQSILEVAHEQEMNDLREKREVFLAERDTELATLRRLEAEENRLLGEKQRRMEQDRIARDLDKQMQRAIVAAKILQGHVSSLLPEIWNNLEPATDAAKKDLLMKSLCPWLTEGVKEETTHIINSRNLLTNIVESIVKDRAKVYAGYSEPTLSEGEDYPCEEEIECEPCAPECCICSSESSDECPSVDYPDSSSQTQ